MRDSNLLRNMLSTPLLSRPRRPVRAAWLECRGRVTPPADPGLQGVAIGEVTTAWTGKDSINNRKFAI